MTLNDPKITPNFNKMTPKEFLHIYLFMFSDFFTLFKILSFWYILLSQLLGINQIYSFIIYINFHYSLGEFYAVGDPVYARDLWLVVELASDDRGRRTREGKESAAHVCSAIRAAQTVGWTPLVVGARSPCCRSVLFVITGYTPTSNQTPNWVPKVFCSYEWPIEKLLVAFLFVVF